MNLKSFLLHISQHNISIDGVSDMYRLYKQLKSFSSIIENIMFQDVVKESLRLDFFYFIIRHLLNEIDTARLIFNIDIHNNTVMIVFWVKPSCMPA